ncbi:hypothetical protein AOQ84DRAFT_145340 [Glonium stellatum]|uniref:Uncharacterized protein n=1 Tax=Glonium stellatum TaxID=574774 RepID=A0A8E2FA07_9PEZI|nr:hypothetical protein AOQ84DRAFT_145340 [Glonium stellatum]
MHSYSDFNVNTEPDVHTMHPTKRRKTTTGMESSQSPGKKTESRKAGKTRGQSEQRGHDFSLEENHSISKVLAVEEDRTSLIHCIDLSNTAPEALSGVIANIVPNASPTVVSTSPWKPSGATPDGFTRHEPFTMFPDLSSTVPDNTLTQQRLLDEALADHFLGPISGSTDPPCSSIPWSTFLTTPSVGESASRMYAYIAER